MSGDDLVVEVDRYIDALFGPADAALEAAERSVTDAGLPQIAVSPSQGRFLALLARMVRPVRILEIGTLAGYSAIWLGRALPPGGRLVTIEANADHAAVARANLVTAGLQDAIEVRVGAALDVLPELEAEGAGPFDLVFIDADKERLPEYFEWALRLGRPGTLIIGDNVIRRGAVLDQDSEEASVQGARRFNELVARHPAVDAAVLQTTGSKGLDGFAFALVRGVPARGPVGPAPDRIIDLSARIPVPTETAFRYFTEPAELERWLTAGVHVELRVGGAYELFWDPADPENDSTIGCRITALDPGRLVAFQWRSPRQFKPIANAADPLTHVVVTFHPEAGGTALRLIHTGWRSDPAWETARAWQEQAWQGALRALEARLTVT